MYYSAQAFVQIQIGFPLEGPGGIALGICLQHIPQVGFFVAKVAVHNTILNYKFKLIEKGDLPDVDHAFYIKNYRLTYI